MEEQGVGHKPEQELSEATEGGADFLEVVKIFHIKIHQVVNIPHTPQSSVEVSVLQIYVYCFQSQTKSFMCTIRRKQVGYGMVQLSSY